MRDIDDIREKSIDFKGADGGSKITSPGTDRSNIDSKFSAPGGHSGEVYEENVQVADSEINGKIKETSSTGIDKIQTDGSTSSSYITAKDLSPSDRKLYGYEYAPDDTRIKVTTRRTYNDKTGKWEEKIEIPYFSGKAEQGGSGSSAFSKVGSKAGRAGKNIAKKGVTSAGRRVGKVGLDQIRGWTRDGKPDLKEANAMKRGAKGTLKVAKKPLKKATKKTVKTTAKVTAKTTKTAVKLTTRIARLAVRATAKVVIASAPVLLPVALLAAILVPFVMMCSTASTGITIESIDQYSASPSSVNMYPERTVIFNKLSEYFNYDSNIVWGIMFGIYVETGMRANNLEDKANRQWNVDDETYTDLVNAGVNTPDAAGAITREEFINSIYDGKHFQQYNTETSSYEDAMCGYGLIWWREKERKEALYDYAVNYFSAAGKDFDISDEKMQVEFLCKLFDEDEELKAVVDKMKTHDTGNTGESGAGFMSIIDSLFQNSFLASMQTWLVEARGYDPDNITFNQQLAEAFMNTCMKQNVVDEVVRRAVEFCEDDSHGYSLAAEECTSANDTKNKDLCCAQFVCVIYNDTIPGCMPFNAGVQGLESELKSNSSFVEVTSSVDASTTEGMMPGDIIIWRSATHYMHAQIYIGDGKIAHASDFYGHPETGDQTGNEVCVKDYWNPTGTKVTSINGEPIQEPAGGYETEYIEVFRYITESGFIWPTESHSVTSYYGYRGDIGVDEATSDHPAIDIGGTIGDSIYAVASGEVTEIGETPHRGKYVIIKHDNGYMTRSQHMNSIAVSRGDLVLQGQVIGELGETGIGSGPHLHIEVYPPGKDANRDYPSGTIDPLTVLPR